MATKEKVLKLFEENKGMVFSGEELARTLSVSRTAVWKAVKSLREEGYSITGTAGEGYALAPDTDILSIQGIQKYLRPPADALHLTVLQKTESTNTLLRKAAVEGAPEGTVIAANCQTKGKGRIGRNFYSPSDTGVYLSILLRPTGYSASQATRLTTMAAVAACEAMESTGSAPAAIKWVNDIFIDGKKVCGILTEAAFDLESASPEYIIVGIGFNVYPPKAGFPDELTNIAGAIFPSPLSDGKNRLAAAFLNRFCAIYHDADKTSYVSAYRERCFVIGNPVRVIRPSGERNALALDIDNACRLLVRYEDGSEEVLSSGEISIRLKERNANET